MKKKVIFGVLFIVAVVLLWLVTWGDFDEWRYSKNLHCMTFQNSRKVEICKSIEKYQEYEFFGHAMISAGYRANFTTAKKAWCELSITEPDLSLLKGMQIEGPMQLQNGSDMLLSMLAAELSLEGVGYMDHGFASELIKEGCPK